MRNPALATIMNIPDVERIFLEPDQAEDYRKTSKLEEVIDTMTEAMDAYRIHINICRRKEPIMSKTFIAHCCMTLIEGNIIWHEEEMDIVYSFKTFHPEPIDLVQILLSDFGHYILQLRIEDECTVH